MQRTSGPILNIGVGKTLTFAIRNSSNTLLSVVELELFIINGTGMPKTPIVHELFAVPPLANIIRTYSIAGALAYEFQADTTSGSDFTANLFSSDSNGNLIAAQRVLGSETTQITNLTPVP